MISQPQYQATLAGLGAWWANDAAAPLVIVPSHITDWLLALVSFGDAMLRSQLQPCGSADFPLTRNTLPDVEPR